MYLKVALVSLIFGTFHMAGATKIVPDCSAYHEGEFVQLVIGPDYQDIATPSELTVYKSGVEVINVKNVKQTYLNVGTDDEPFMNQAWLGSKKGASLTVRIPEQAGPALEYVALSLETSPGVFRYKDLEMTCE